jgi:hypothetical protein
MRGCADDMSSRRGFTGRVTVSVVLVALILARGTDACAYSVLAHEAIIDSAWDTNIRPLLLKRFPNSTPEQLKEAHGYAYGGAIIQDMGYYPHGRFFFSDLTHYVRSGDFIVALLRDATDLDGYAFALGAMAHYAADTEGHPIGTNRAVPILYPRLEKKFGDTITYEQNRLAHVKTEFGFDVLEVAKGRYAPDNYHDFIGFDVARPLLEQAFRETYGLELKDVLENEEKALGSYRYDVSQLIPKATRIAWSLKEKDIQKDQPGITRRKFLYNLSRASYRKNWGNDYRPLSPEDKFLAFLIRIIPKIGPLKVLQFKTPTPETERLFEAGFNAALDRYRGFLAQVDAGDPNLPNKNFDIGSVSAPGEYRLDDEAQAQLLEELAAQNFAGVAPEMRSELLNYFSYPDAPYAMKKKAKKWAKVQTDLNALRLAATVGVSVPEQAIPPTRTIFASIGRN